MDPKLDEYQIEAMNRLKTGSILKGGVGSGKSRTGLAYYFCRVCGGIIDGLDRGYQQDYIPMKHPIDLYIFTTARKRDEKEWESELEPFLITTNNTGLYHDRMKVVIDSWNNIKKYTNLKGCFIIFDEQKAVGAGAWSKAFIKIAKQNQWIMLSATPGDTWVDYLPVFIANGFYKNRKEFFDRHVIYSRYSKYPKIYRYLEDQYLSSLRDKILVEMDYSNPTIRHWEVVNVDYDRQAYRELFKKRWNYEENKPIENISELSYLLRKVVNSDPSRIQAVLQIAKKHQKIIIFYNFNYEREILLHLDYGENYRIAEWNGFNHESIPQSDRWVYLVQYASGAEAWNCIQTNVIIFYSASYSYKATEQAAGRIDRRNTPYTDLYYYTFKSYASIDQAIYKALQKKKNFNESRFFQRFESPQKLQLV